MEKQKEKLEHTDVAQLMKDLRDELGISQGELAKLANKPQSTISRIESNTMNPSYLLVAQIFAAAGKKLSISFV